MQGVLGVGGGIVMVSSLNKLARMEQIKAVGTSLPTQIVSNVISGVTFAADGKFDATAALCIGGTAMFSARAGARLGSRMSEASLKGAFGGLLLILAPCVAVGSRYEQRMAMPAAVNAPASNTAAAMDDAAADQGRTNILQRAAYTNPSVMLEKLAAEPARNAMHCALGTAVGAVSGALGVGATPLMITFLTLAGDMDHKTCIGTALCAVVPPTISGSIAHMQLGNTLWRCLPLLAAGAALGGFCGSSVALELPNAQLQQAFAAFCTWNGASMLRKSGLLRRWIPR